jgi:transcription elongation factor GreB
MSRAFIKEDSDSPPALPDLPIGTAPNHVTPRGLALLRAAVAQRRADLEALRARADRMDRLPEAAAERDIRYLEARLASAIPVDTAALPLTSVAFGLTITVADEEGRETRYRIVGEDEADPPAGLITAQAPLARAMMGAVCGDTVAWRKPGGNVMLEVIRIDHDDSHA